MKYVVPDSGQWLYWDGNEKHYFASEREAQLAASQDARRTRMADKFMDRLTKIKAGAKDLYAAQKVACEANLTLLVLQGDVTITTDPVTGVTTVVINKSDEELAALGEDRTECERGLLALFKILNSVSPSDSQDIVKFMAV